MALTSSRLANMRDEKMTRFIAAFFRSNQSSPHGYLLAAKKKKHRWRFHAFRVITYTALVQVIQDFCLARS